jgi:hypothetical protein
MALILTAVSSDGNRLDVAQLLVSGQANSLRYQNKNFGRLNEKTNPRAGIGYVSGARRVQ